MELNEDKWRIVLESDNFLVVKKKRFKRIDCQDFLELLEERREKGYRPHLMSYGWDGTIIFEKEKN